MPRQAKELSPIEVKRLGHPGRGGNVTFAVGGVSGLLLQVTPNGGRSWLLRAAVAGKRREIGLGGYPDVMLAQARERAREAKDKIREGIDPVEERKAARAALETARRRGLTFKAAVDKALAGRLDGYKNAKHRDQWRSTLETYAVPELGAMLVHEITVQDVFRVLDPIWRTKTETASRLRGRIEAVLSWAKVQGHRDGENPAQWHGNLKELLPTPTKVSRTENQPALQVDDAQRWFAALRARKGIGSRALGVCCPYRRRSWMVRGATWEEIDLDQGLWTIPAVRMKMEREHRAPLTVQELELLKALPRFEGTALVFPSTRDGEMSDMTLNEAMKRLHQADISEGGPGFLDAKTKRPAVPHGLRSTFRDWVADRTHFPGEMAEIALAHKVANEVEAAYRRGHMVEKRRKMMAAWGKFLAGAR